MRRLAREEASRRPDGGGSRLSLQRARCRGSPSANCGVDGVHPHPEIGGEILYTCYQPGHGHMELFIVRSDGGGVTQLTDDGAGKDGPRWRPY